MPHAPAHPLVSLVLAAGKGTRMGDPTTHKVCLPLDGTTVIARAVRQYAAAGAAAHYVVVGAQADQVRAALAATPQPVVYCTQAEPRGTGNAARAAADVLRAVGFEGDVLAVAGDKVIEPAALNALVEAFHHAGADLAFITGDAVDFPTSGRVLRDAAGHPAAIVEVSDIARAEILSDLRRLTAARDVPPEEAAALFETAFPTEKKARAALGPLLDAIDAGQPVTADLLAACYPEDGRDLSAATALEANLSVYLFRAPALYDALDRLTSDNAQREEYLTDAVSILAARGARIVTVPAARATDVMAFNTREEYDRIVRHLAARAASAGGLDAGRTVRERLRSLEAGPASLAAVYGAEGADLPARHAMLVRALHAYLDRFGDGPVLVSRAPGRLNAMGRHIDHQGGYGNFLAIDREAVLVIGARSDGRVVAHSTEPARFREARFAIADTLAGYSGQPWADFVDHPAVAGRAASRRGEWSLYLEAAVARFQAHAGDRPLRGMNIVAAGDIPMAAGLSSSSALVVAAAEGIVAMNGLGVSPERFVELCGEGEWYVGTRGGAGDHAAMKFARPGHAVQMGFLPFRVMAAAPLPDECAFLVCHSGLAARKTAGARDAFNHRVACYHIGRELLKLRRPDLAPRIAHLRDVNAETLELDPPELARLLAALPEAMSRDEVRTALGPAADPYLCTHGDDLTTYPVRSVVLFGLAECERARGCADLLLAGRITEFGQWMNASHDGDRVAKWHGDQWAPFTAGAADLDPLAAALAAKGPDALARVPGAYACSTPEIDQIVDTALPQPGVYGAQLSGAGLGGCVMVLAHRGCLRALRAELIARCYETRGVEPVMFACCPVSGSGLID